MNERFRGQIASSRDGFTKMEKSLHVDAHRRTWHLNDAAGLEDALAWRDSLGGAEFWLAHGDGKYPALAVRVSGAVADLHFFPEDRHPGFRCLGGEGLSPGGATKFVFEGCDPRSGEATPNEFVVPFATACSIAREFMQSGQKSSSVSWIEL
jgi:hypothetical protein